MDVASLDDVLFANGGELGARMAAIDWAATPLGPVSSWPPSLKTCVRILLTSRQPMFVWWGSSLVNLYNDAYKAIVGGKHPHCLGQPASAVWREIWSEIEPRVESAMRENVGTYDEALLLIMERHGYREETYYTFSYSPVPGDDGLPGGIICANSDDTDRIIGERQLTLLRELGARTTEARTVAEVCRLAAEGLATNGRDLPFAAIYLDDGDGLVLHGTAGITAGARAAPVRIGTDASAWLREGYGATEPSLHLDVGDRAGPLPTGAWDEPPKHVATLTLTSLHGKTGLLVVGLNPFRPFDDRYQRFLLLVAGQIEASLASAGAYEAERRRAEELAELDRAKTAFFSNVSHEFRTPLTLMLGPLEDSLVDPVAPLPAPQRDRLEVVKRNSLRLLRLVNTLLDFSRIEAGRTRVVLAAMDLAALTTDLASTFRSAMDRAGLALVVDTPKLSRPVVVDRDMWEKIVLNLLSNAFKFTFEGKVEVRLRERGDQAELVVTDTGTGIPAAELPKIFERFHRVHGARARTHEGSGIGLALVHELVKALGGDVSVTSTEGRGTAFTITLPFGDVARIAAPSTHETSPRESTAIHADAFVEEALRWLPNDARPPASERPSGRPTMTEAPEAQSRAPRAPASAQSFEESVDIVVADDNADMRDYVARLLRTRWTVRAVADGREALVAVRTRRPTLVVTDVMMPNLDGFGLIRELRADPRTQAIPVLMLSARAGEESRVEGLEAGADDYLVKPFSARELIARVATRVELERLGSRLERERAAIASLFERAPIPVAILRGPDLVLEVANPACAAILGREVRGKRLRDALPELEAQGYVAQFRKVQHTREPVIGVEARIELVRDEKRVATYWNFIFAPLASDHDEADSVVAICTEVTAQVVAREQAASLAEEANAANRAKDEFLAMLGHELRNPLAPITTALELLRLRGTSSREQSVIERQVAHLTRLVDDLLDVSRITRAKVDLRRQPSELGPIVSSALEIASPLLEQKGHQVEVDVAREGLVLDVDRDRIAQVLANLLTNAAKYSDGSSRIDVRARREGPRVRIEVEDRGIGIAPEMLPRIFEAFVQQPQSIDRSKGGLGLGLAIVRGLVEAHGGVVRAESAGDGRGSLFVVDLPAAEGKAASAPARTIAAEHPTGALRVLVVDDNDDAAEVLSEALMSLGYQTAVANDGPNALAIAEVFRPRIALLDIGLPVMDGYELARRLRELATADPLLELIAVTGYGQDRDRERAREAGFGRHLVKPLDLELLRQVLRGVQSGAVPVGPRNELGLDAGRGD